MRTVVWILTMALVVGPATTTAARGADAPSTAVTAGVPDRGVDDARIAAPTSVVVIGDSISQATGSNGSGAPGGGLGSPRPAASWATGDHPGLESYADRLGAHTGAEVDRVNLSANGATMRDDFVDQVQRVPDHTDLVLVQMGGNDLCRNHESEMTPVEQFRDRVRAGLDWLRAHRPDTLVQIASIPDIYSLWYVRGAPHRGEQLPVVGFVVRGREGPRAPRSIAENNNKRAARILWDTLGVVPCRTMLFRPNIPRNVGPTPDPTNTAEQRRQRVRERNQRFNEVLAEECAAVLRCSFDDHALFDYTSNRDANGVLLADKDQWRFVDGDISTQDHFHPSFAGQRKLAEVAWTSGFDWDDVTAPTVTADIDPTRDWHDGPVTVGLTASDDAGVRGLEYRVHRSSESPETVWTTVLGASVPVVVSATGRSTIEVRAVDRNGNVSATERFVVGVDQVAPTARILSPSPGSVVTLGTPVSVRHHCEDATSGVAVCNGEPRAGHPIDTARPGPRVLRLTATDRAGNTATAASVVEVRYAWGGFDRPLRAGEVREHPLGTPLPIGFRFGDVHGRGAPEAGVEVVLVGPDGTETHPAPAFETSGSLVPWRAAGSEPGGSWSDRFDRYVLVTDTSTLAAGVWDVVARLDDGSEHRVNVVLTREA